MAADPSVALGELRGFLEAFARFNDAGDISFTFSFDRLPPAHDVRAAVERSFAGAATNVSVMPVAAGIVREALKRWLFTFQNPRGDHLEDPSGRFALSDASNREETIDRVVELLAAVGPATAVWRVDVETKGWYEGVWDDFVYETADGAYLLHFGESD